jgi:hypothetical protein
MMIGNTQIIEAISSMSTIGRKRMDEVKSTKVIIRYSKG